MTGGGGGGGGGGPRQRTPRGHPERAREHPAALVLRRLHSPTAPYLELKLGDRQSGESKVGLWRREQWRNRRQSWTRRRDPRRSQRRRTRWQSGRSRQSGRPHSSCSVALGLLVLIFVFLSEFSRSFFRLSMGTNPDLIQFNSKFQNSLTQKVYFCTLDVLLLCTLLISYLDLITDY